jgi:hypothetical protein
VDFLAVRREILEKVTQEMERIDLLKQHEFFLKSIFFTRKKIAYVIEVVTTKVVELVHTEIKALKEEVAQKEQVIASQTQTIALLVQTTQTLEREMKERAATYETQYKQIVDQIEHLAQFRAEILSANRDFTASVERQIETKIQMKTHDLQHQIDQVKAMRTANFVTNTPDFPTDLFAKNASQSEPQETDFLEKEIPANYGLQEDEKQTLICAFPRLEKWFKEMPSSVSESEILEISNTHLNSRSNAVKQAISNRIIRRARGRGKKLQTDSVLRWLLCKVKMPANKEKNTGEIAFLEQKKETPNTPVNQLSNTEEIGSNATRNQDDNGDQVTEMPELVTNEYLPA